LSVDLVLTLAVTYIACVCLLNTIFCISVATFIRVGMFIQLYTLHVAYITVHYIVLSF